MRARPRRLLSAVTLGVAALFLGGPSVAASVVSDRASLVAETRAGVARFADVRVALAAGYRPEQSVGPILHYLNQGYLRAGPILDPQRPEALVYKRSPSGLHLVAAMFMMHRAGESGPAIDGSRAGWHTHSSCWGPGGMGVPVPGGPCPEGTEPVRTAEMLHVWLINVPGGPFAIDMAPPLYRCDIGGVGITI